MENNFIEKTVIFANCHCEKCGYDFRVSDKDYKTRYSKPFVRSNSFFDCFPFLTKETELESYETIVYSECPKCNAEYIISWSRKTK